MARLGRLSPAARHLGVEHSTVARQIDGLEKTIGARLFDRRPDGFILTEGRTLLPMAEMMESTVAVVSEELKDRDASISGEVRLGIPEGLAVVFLTPRIKLLLDTHPRLTVELLALPRLANLASREADLAITLDPPRRGSYKEAVLAGIGLAVLAPYIGDSDPRLVKVLPDEACFQHTFWLAAHADRLRLKRVRLVWDYLRSLIDVHRRLFLYGDK